MKFYPATAPVPQETRTNRLLLRPLRVTDVEPDYDAVMSSSQQLRCWNQSEWPADDFTLAQNRDDLQRHEREHGQRIEFTFTVLDPIATRCLGCVYIVPLWSEAAYLCPSAAYAAGVRFWVRTSEIATDLDKHLLDTLRNWFVTEWPFECVVFATSPQDARQVTLLREAGFERHTAFTLSDGLTWWAFC
ncbi:MAG: hypothetical protein Kow00121_64030 [Elainellaceae cyanobacterium]